MIKKIRGFNDWFFEKGESFFSSRNQMESFFHRRAYSFVELPIIEEEELFTNSIGNNTDIVNKEMFYIQQRKENRSWVLKPEGTAQVARMVVENKIDKDESWKIRKFFYFSPFFRYERPQKERYRQFYSLGGEIYFQDETMRKYLLIEMISDLANLFPSNELRFRINYLPVNNADYLKALKDYFKKNVSSLCEDCQDRINTNVMRILDCKKDKGSPIIKDAPKSIDFSDRKEGALFWSVVKSLTNRGVNVQVDSNLVRGLDYYGGVVFEIVNSTDTNHSICGGGEYSGIFSKISTNKKQGTNWLSMGFGIGFERAMQYLAPVDKSSQKTLVLRRTMSDDFFIIRNFLVNMNSRKLDVFVRNSTRSIAKEFEWAEKNAFQNFIIIGEEEIEKGSFKIRNLKTKTEDVVVWQEK